ncbi:ankyrin repeat domain-containing protein [Persephonella sp.]|uniref:ankyrin repeat domain-containing protein n=1 Tax=Persephonella sp. TaxID=2060922 RepID=UPI002612924B|nr:ankyrin repeat domain-containing protein [Persephonella sp.]
MQKSSIFLGLIFLFIFSFSFANSNLNQQLIEAVKKNDLQQVKKLIKNGADVNFKDKKGFSVLHYAAYFGDIKLVKYLVEKGADVCVRNKKIREPWTYAFKRKPFNKEIVEYLKSPVKLFKCMDKYFYDNNKGCFKRIKKFLKKGVSPNFVCRGKTPLQWIEERWHEYVKEDNSFRERYENLIKLLKSYGAR